MKRNFDSVSHYSASDKAEFSNLKKMKEQFEQQVKQLTFENQNLKVESKDNQEVIKSLTARLKETENKLESKIKEVEKLQNELNKKTKILEDRLANINSKYRYRIVTLCFYRTKPITVRPGE